MAADIDVNRRSLTLQLSRMVRSNVLRKDNKGMFIISENQKAEFHPLYDEDMKKIADVIRSSYPFLDICIWSIDEIKRLFHYASSRNVVYVEVDRDAVDGVFWIAVPDIP